MLEKDHTIVGEELTLTVTMPPLCRAVVKEVGDSLCSCLQNFRSLYEKRDSMPDITKRNVTKDGDGKLFFTKCGNGDMRVRITRSDALPIDPSYIATHQAQLHSLFQQLFECTDHFHVKEGGRENALEYDEVTQTYFVYLHRGLPKHEAEKFPKVTKPKIGTLPRRSI